MSRKISRKLTFRLLLIFFCTFITVLAFLIWPDTRAFLQKNLEAQKFRRSIAAENPRTKDEFWDSAFRIIQTSRKKPNPFNPRISEIVDLLSKDKEWATTDFINIVKCDLNEQLRYYCQYKDPAWDEVTAIAYGASKFIIIVKGIIAILIGSGVGILLLSLPWLIIIFLSTFFFSGKVE